MNRTDRALVKQLAEELQRPEKEIVASLKLLVKKGYFYKDLTKTKTPYVPIWDRGARK